jgi:hypothetical protein
MTAKNAAQGPLAGIEPMALRFLRNPKNSILIRFVLLAKKF